MCLLKAVWPAKKSSPKVQTRIVRGPLIRSMTWYLRNQDSRLALWLAICKFRSIIVDIISLTLVAKRHSITRWNSCPSIFSLVCWTHASFFLSFQYITLRNLLLCKHFIKRWMTAILVLQRTHQSLINVTLLYLPLAIFPVWPSCRRVVKQEFHKSYIWCCLQLHPLQKNHLPRPRRYHRQWLLHHKQ